MDIVKNYAERVSVFVVLSAYIDLVLPNNSYRKYIRIILGAILTSIVLEPLSMLLGVIQ